VVLEAELEKARVDRKMLEEKVSQLTQLAHRPVNPHASQGGLPLWKFIQASQNLTLISRRLNNVGNVAADRSCWTTHATESAIASSASPTAATSTQH
jgi:hypothetical protein